MVVLSYPIVYKSVELLLVFITFLLVVIPSGAVTSQTLFCSHPISNGCFAPMLYPFSLALISILVLGLWLASLLSGRVLPTADYGTPLLGAACWYAAGGVIIHVTVEWKDAPWSLTDAGPPGSWYTAIVFCMLIAVVYTVEGFMACACKNIYTAILYPPAVIAGAPAPTGVVTPMGVGVGAPYGYGYPYGL